MTDQRTLIEEDLWEMILKYKQSLTQREYPPVTERETDRQNLRDHYEQLETLQHKLLDTRAYLQLGRVQGAVNKTLLADNIAPRDRLDMLAKVVRMLSTPVVYLPAAGTVSLARLAEHGARDLVHDFDKRVMATAPLTLRVRTREFEEGQLARVRGRLMRKLDRPISRDDLEQQLDFEEAEVLSQIASRKDHRLLWREGELRLEPCDPKEEADLERMAVVIKGSQ